MAEMVRVRFPEVRVVPNPQGSAAAGLNRAFRAAAHAIIVRCDACCVLPGNYVRLAVDALERTSAANVGGRQCPVGTTAFERAVGLAMTTPLGAGDARYRLGGAEGPGLDSGWMCPDAGRHRRAVCRADAEGGFLLVRIRHEGL